MANYLILNQNYVQDGLGTLTYTVPTTGKYNVKAQITVTPDTSLSVLVKNNGSTVYTMPTMTPGQIGQEFKANLNLTAADSLTVVLSSSAAVDNLLNSIKSNISIGDGDA